VQKNIVIALLCGIVVLLGLISSHQAEIKNVELGYHIHYHSFVDSFYVTIQIRSPEKEFDRLQVFYELRRQGILLREGSGTRRNSRNAAAVFTMADKDSVVRKDKTAIVVFWGIGRDGLFKKSCLLKPRAVTILNNCHSRTKQAKGEGK